MAASECPVPRTFINWSQLLTGSKVNHKQIKVLSPALDTRWRSWLRHCARSRVRFPMLLLEFHWHNSSGRIMTLGLAQPLTEMSKGKGKLSHYRPGQTLRVPGVWGSQISRQSAHEGGKVLSLTHRRSLPPRNLPGTHFCYRLSRPQGHSVAGRIMSMKNSSDTIANRTRDLPICSAVPQTTALPHVPFYACALGFHIFEI